MDTQPEPTNLEDLDLDLATSTSFGSSEKATPFSQDLRDFDDDDYYQEGPVPPSTETMRMDHLHLLSTIPPRESTTNPETPESRKKLLETITSLLQDSSIVEGTGPNGEKISIKRGIVTFVKITISENTGTYRLGSHIPPIIARDISTEIVTTFQINEEGIIEISDSSFNSTHSSIHSPRKTNHRTRRNSTIDLQNILDNLQNITRGNKVSSLRKFLRGAVITAIELTPLTDGHYDKFRRENPLPPNNPEPKN